MELRDITRRLRAIPGAVVMLDAVRRNHAPHERHVVIDDFDGDLKIRVDLQEDMGNSIYWYGAYNRNLLALLRRRLRDGMTVIDVGANIGEVSLFAAKAVGKRGRVISFEPMPEIAAALRENISINGFSTVEVVEQGVADRSAVLPIYAGASDPAGGLKNAGLATLFPRRDEASSVSTIHVTSLDEWHAKDLRRIDLIKLDIEGAELPALRGAQRLLSAHRPDLVIEVQRAHCRAAGYEPAEILDLLAPLGYRFFTIGRRGTLSPTDATRMREIQNVFATAN